MPSQPLGFGRTRGGCNGSSRADAASPPFVGEERRAAVRYPARPGCEAIRLSWRYGDGIEGECAGRIMDLGFGGALLEVESLPPACAGLWLRVRDEQGSDWVEVTGVEARRHGSGPHVLRVAFAVSCPYSLFRWVVWGPHRDPRSETARTDEPATADDLPWSVV
jgi:hypothetical protein